MRTINATRGFILLPVALGIALIAAIAFMLNNQHAMNADATAGEMEAEQARYVAEAGMRHACWSANTSACAGYALAATAFGPHSYGATFTPTGGSPVSIAATGTLANGNSRTVNRTGVRIYEAPIVTTIQPGATEGKDTSISSWKPTWNYGAHDVARVEDFGEFSTFHGLVRFDLGTIPSTANVTSAVLELYQNYPAADGGPVGIRRITGDWIEGASSGGVGPGANWTESDTGTPWASPGGDYDPTSFGTTSIAPGAVGWNQWDITALVRSWVAGSYANHGLILVPEAANTLAYFDSSDAVDPARYPKLTITYACECGAGASNSVTLQPGVGGEDGYIDDGGPATNWGDDTQILLSNKINSQKRGLLRFGLNGISPAVTVSSATLELNLEGIGSGGTASVDAHRVATAWLESQTTWNEASTGTNWGTPGGDYDLAVVATAGIDDAFPGPTQWDVTALVADWVNDPANNFGLILIGSSGVNHADFTSSDASDPAQHPRLIVDYSCPCGIDCSPPPGCNADYVPTAEVSNWGYGDGSNYADMHGITYVPEGFVLDGVTTPVGGGFVAVDWNEGFFTLYDTAGAVLSQTLPTPAGNMNGVALVEGGAYAGYLAVLQDMASQNVLHFVDPAGGAATVSIDIVAISSGPSGLSYIGQSAGETYDEHLAITDAQSDAIYIVDQTGSLVHTIDLTGLVGEMKGIVHLRGTDKFLIVDDVDDLARIVDLAGAVTSSYDLTPYDLVRTRAVTVNPNNCDHVIGNNRGASGSDLDEVVYLNAGMPAETVLLVVPDAGSLSAQDIARRTLMQSWGYAVAPISASDSQANFDTAVAGADVAYVVEQSQSTVLGEKLKTATIGVVNEEAELHADFGFSGNRDWPTPTDAVEIRDDTHYITSPFSLGWLTIASSNVNVVSLAGGLAPDLVGLSQFVAGQVGLSIIDTGGGLYGGGVAAGRRVQLPWGRTGFDINALNADGETIMRRAIEWVVVGGSGPPPPSCAGTFRDEFNAKSYTGSDGTLPWATDWLEINESDGPTSSDEQVRKDASDYQLRVQDNDGGGEGVEREADLSAYTTATLSFDYRRVGLDDADDYVTVEVSDNGGGSWTEIERFAGPASDGGYTAASHDISASIAPNTRIRFLTSPLMGQNDRVWVDNVEICVE